MLTKTYRGFKHLLLWTNLHRGFWFCSKHTQLFGLHSGSLIQLVYAHRKHNSLIRVFTARMKKATHLAHIEDSDQTGWMPRLIWVFAWRTVILLVLSWGDSYNQIRTTDETKIRTHSQTNTDSQSSESERILATTTKSRLVKKFKQW